MKLDFNNVYCLGLLALLTCASRCHGMGICSYVRRPCHNYARTCLANIIQIPNCCLPCHTPILLKNKNAFSNFSRFFFVFLKMGLHRSKTILKHYYSLNFFFFFLNFSKLSCNFCSFSLTKIPCLIFKIFFQFCTIISFVFVDMKPYGSKNFKTLLLPQIEFTIFSNFCWTFLSVVLKKVLFGYLSFWRFEISRFFLRKLTFTVLSYRKTKNSYYREKGSS